MSFEDVIGTVATSFASVLQGAMDSLSEGFISFLLSPYGLILVGIAALLFWWGRR